MQKCIYLLPLCHLVPCISLTLLNLCVYVKVFCKILSCDSIFAYVVSSCLFGAKRNGVRHQGTGKIQILYQL